MKVTEVIHSVEALYKVTIQLSSNKGLVAAIVNEEAYGLMEQAITDVLGKENVRPRVTTPGGEDFHFYSKLKPGLKATMLGLGCGLAPGLHHPDMTFNRERIHTGTEIMTRAILNTVQAISSHGA